MMTDGGSAAVTAHYTCFGISLRRVSHIAAVTSSLGENIGNSQWLNVNRLRVTGNLQGRPEGMELRAWFLRVYVAAGPAEVKGALLPALTRSVASITSTDDCRPACSVFTDHRSSPSQNWPRCMIKMWDIPTPAGPILPQIVGITDHFCHPNSNDLSSCSADRRGIPVLGERHSVIARWGRI
ncbi:hypothetical protein BOTBODRAFT_148853 [Botryobasidium botryosum FD-172 SS1]|uniref:Uncharacterized protein n=1 Tax=Botryobasidium botryosum (strain FD-172 SS1) TaxID=930990 RepID=A0A067LY81_BOTB1|nr:hypothetical protein BOTBODRAFT_148853 [Botryobasidium botryosum FD-172 SS1]